LNRYDISPRGLNEVHNLLYPLLNSGIPPPVPDVPAQYLQIVNTLDRNNANSRRKSLLVKPKHVLIAQFRIPDLRLFQLTSNACDRSLRKSISTNEYVALARLAVESVETIYRYVDTVVIESGLFRFGIDSEG
jgi:hypothetical protein